MTDALLLTCPLSAWTGDPSTCRWCGFGLYNGRTRWCSDGCGQTAWANHSWLTPKLCECGCGQPVRLATYSQPRYGYRRGDPKRFVNGHNRRSRLETRYVIEDRGYTTPCWIWRGAPNANGYGQTGRGGTHELAHRYVFRESGNELPKGEPLDHLCRIRICVNPTHLERVTNAENIRRGLACKLTLADVDAIRASTETNVALARRFGVGERHVSRVRRRLAWA